MKSKVTKLEQWGVADDYGNFSHNIAFEDGTEGSYRGNPTKGLSFKIGEEGEYEVEKKVSGKGKEYNKITPPKKDFNKGGSYDSSGAVIGMSIKAACEMFTAGKVPDLKAIEPTARWLVDMSIKLKAEYKDKL